MPPSASQRAILGQFMQITGVQERIASRYLKNNGWKIEAACESYFQATGLGGPPQAREKEVLTKLFESYRTPLDDPDTVGVEGLMKYLGTDLQVNLENAELLIPCEIMQVPAIGEMTKEGFVEGWKKLGLETLAKQKAYLANAKASLSTDEELFKRVYMHTFLCAREKGQKALALENAITYWNMLFSPPGRVWQTASADWLQLWIEYLQQNYTKTVNKDMWGQAYKFHKQTMAHDSVAFWNEEDSWPTVIDEFVAWVKKKRGDTSGVESMETD